MSWNDSAVVPVATNWDNLTDTERLSNAINLKPGEIANITLPIDFSGTTDDLGWRIYAAESGTIDGAADDGIAMMSGVIAVADGDIQRAPIVVKDVRSFKLGLTMSGSTDTAGDATPTYSLDGVDA